MGEDEDGDEEILGVEERVWDMEKEEDEEEFGEGVSGVGGIGGSENKEEDKMGMEGGWENEEEIELGLEEILEKGKVVSSKTTCREI